MKIIISGSGGQLGQSLIKANQLNKNFNIYSFEKKELDITNYDNVKNIFSKIKPNVFINTSAYTNVNSAEENPFESFKINALAPKIISDLCRINNSQLIHFSTDYVFNGSKEKKYIETDIAKPISIYGQSKLKGEQLIIKSGCRYLIIRLSWLYNISFENNLINKIIKLALSKSEVKFVCDEFSIPTCCDELTKQIWNIVNNYIDENNGPLGLYHFSQTGEYISIYNLAKFIYKYLKSKNIKVGNIIQSTSKEFNKKDIRPKFSALDNSLIINNFTLNILNWETSLLHNINNKLLER